MTFVRVCGALARLTSPDPTAFDAPKGIGPKYVEDSYDCPCSCLCGSTDASGDYNYLSSLWQGKCVGAYATLPDLLSGWLDANATAQARTHYGGYSTLTPQGLRIISINGDFVRSPSLEPISLTLPVLSEQLMRAHHLYSS